MEKEESAMDYRKLGFRCGLEIHQQLEGKKLFCNCETLNSDNAPDAFAKRKLRAVVGEMGRIDIAAAHEMVKAKTFQYESSTIDTCLIDYDEEPPLPLNPSALDTALTISLLLGAKIADEIHVMRKIVIDGSNVSGFQRTALIATGGEIETSHGKVGIPTICLEEESAQKIGSEGETICYKLDRLGIPLLEIATSASILSADHAKEVAAHLGMMLRSVEGVKRGIGTIRQDVNISIEGGARVEVKGFQDLRSIPKVIEFEVRRQKDLIYNGKNVNKEVRKAEADFTTSFLRPMPGSARMYPETDVLPVRISKDHLEHLKKNLPKLLSEKANEYSELYNLDEDVAKQLLKINYNFKYLIASPASLVLKNLDDNIRAAMRVPNLSEIYIKKLQKITESLDSVSKMQFIPFNQIKVYNEEISNLGNFGMKNEILKTFEKMDFLPKIATRTLLNTIPELKKEGIDDKKITEEILRKILELVASDKISKEAIPNILKDLDKGKRLEDVIPVYEILSDEDLEKEIRKIISEKPNLSAAGYMGLVMAKHRGKVEGKKAMELIKKNTI